MDWLKPFRHHKRTQKCSPLEQSARGVKTTVGVHQECLLSPIQFNQFLEKITQETFHDHHTSISIGGRPTRNLRFADDIDLVVGNNGKPQNLIDRLVDRATAYGMEVSTGKIKIITNSASNISADISMNGQKLEEVTRFKYLRATPCKDDICSA